MKTELLEGRKKLKNFLLCCMEKWVGGHSFAHQRATSNINVCRFSKLEQPEFLHLLRYRPETCRELQNRLSIYMAGGGGGQGLGEQRQFAHESFDAGSGTRLECQQRVFVRTGKTLWK